MVNATQKPIIVVIGGTGAQGAGLVSSIIKEGKYTARVVTRDTESEKAKALVKSGAQVVKADLDNAEAVKKAFEGAYGVYANTNIWEHHSVQKDQAQVKNIANAAKSAGIKHLVWSTLEDTRAFVAKNPKADIPVIKDGYRVPHFDSKGEANKFFTEAKVPTTFVYTSFYWDNFCGMMPPARKDGALSVTLPMEADKPMTGIASIDIGKCAYGIFKDPSMIGKSVGLAGEALTMPQLCEKMSKSLGEKVSYVYVPRAVFAGFGFPGANDLANMFQFYSTFSTEICAQRPVAVCKKLNPELQSFDQWMASTGKAKIPLSK